MTDIVPDFLDDQARAVATEQPIPAVAGAVAVHLDGDPSGHDMFHVWRVFEMAMTIATQSDEAVDRTVLGIAALAHDIHRTVGEGIPPRESLPTVRETLAEAGVDPTTVEAVCACVAVHDDYDYRGDDYELPSVEAAILQDADNLDAMGAVGIARDFAYTGDAGNPIWDPENDTPSGKRHIHDKLLRLREEMNTEAGREIAAERHDFLEAFAERFEAEWHGES
jgi:uncharacterized protein